MPITLELPLHLPEVRVLTNWILEDGTLLIEVESTLQTAQCHRCGREIDRFHGSDRPIQCRHLLKLLKRRCFGLDDRSNGSAAGGWISKVHSFGLEIYTSIYCGLHGKSHRAQNQYRAELTSSK